MSGISMLSAGDDSVTFFATADIDALALSDAGTGDDALAFDGLAAAIDPNAFLNFETAVLENGALIVSAPAGASTFSAPDGFFVLGGSTLVLGDRDDLLGTLTIEDGSRVAAAGDSPGRNEITGDLALGGLLTPVDDTPDDRTSISGKLDGRDGAIALDVGFGKGGAVQSDRVPIGGALTGSASVWVNPLAEGGGAATLLTFAGAASADLSLANDVTVDGLLFDLVQSGNSYVLSPEGVTEEVGGMLALGPSLAGVTQD